MAKKEIKVPFANHITEQKCTIYDCDFNGKECLYRFIKTRQNQPQICLNCLKELGVKDNYKLIPCQQQWRYEIKKDFKRTWSWN